MRACLVSLLSVAGAASISVVAAETPHLEPQIMAIHPIGAQRGTRRSITIEARGMANAYAVWFESPSLVGRVLGVAAGAKSDEHHITVDLDVAPDTRAGAYPLRLVGPAGVSNGQAFFVLDEPAFAEEDLPAEPTRSARRLPPAPLVVSGKLAAEGALRSYAFEAARGEQLLFEVLDGGRYDPQVALYEPATSWFDAHGTRRLAFNDEPNRTSRRFTPALAYRFGRRGTFFAAVSDFRGRGGQEYSFLLRVVPSQAENAWGAAGFAGRGPSREGTETLSGFPSEYHERGFVRQLGPDRIRSLMARTAPSGTGTVPDVPVVREEEARPAHAKDSPRAITIPTLIDGAIDHPGDIDRYSFTVAKPLALAVEIQTPARPAPLFAPLVRIVDDGGQELLSNVFARSSNPGFVEKSIEPKIIVSLNRAGTHTLEIRDATFRNGGRDFRYRVLLRPQVPHVGAVTVAASFEAHRLGGLVVKGDLQEVNLAPGETRKLLILTEQEEGFAGEIALAFEGLPAGISAFAAAEVRRDRPPPFDEGKKEWFRPGTQLLAMVLSAANDAPWTRLPVAVRLGARPVVDGKLGPLLPVRTIPVMIVSPDLRRHPVPAVAEVLP